MDKVMMTSNMYSPICVKMTVPIVKQIYCGCFCFPVMLFEGTFQHYHGFDAARAKKYLEFAVEAAGS